MTMDNVVRLLLDSYYLSAHAYVKPGCVHRLSSGRGLDEYVSTAHALAPLLPQAYEAGESVAKGRKGFPEIGLGSLVLKAVREIYSWMGRAPELEPVLAGILFSVAAGHYFYSKNSLEASGIMRSMMLLLSSTVSKDAEAFYDAVKTSRSTWLAETLEAKGITKSRIDLEGLNLADVIRELSDATPLFQGLSTGRSMIQDIYRNIVRVYGDTRNPNKAVVEAYVALVMDRFEGKYRRMLEEAISLGLMDTRKGASKLLELDRELRRNRVDFNKYTPLLTLATAFSLVEGVRL